MVHTADNIYISSPAKTELLPRSKSVDTQRTQDQISDNYITSNDLSKVHSSQRTNNNDNLHDSHNVYMSNDGYYMRGTTNDPSNRYVIPNKRSYLTTNQTALDKNKLLNSADIRKENIQSSNSDNQSDIRNANLPDRGGKYMTVYTTSEESLTDVEKKRLNSTDNRVEKSKDAEKMSSPFPSKYMVTNENPNVTMTVKSENYSKRNSVSSCDSSVSEKSIDEMEALKLLSALPEPPKDLPQFEEKRASGHGSRRSGKSRKKVAVLAEPVQDTRHRSPEPQIKTTERQRSQSQNRPSPAKRKARHDSENLSTVRGHSVDRNHNDKYMVDRNEYTLYNSDARESRHDSHEKTQSKDISSGDSLGSDTSTLITAL